MAENIVTPLRLLDSIHESLDHAGAIVQLIGVATNETSSAEVRHNAAAAAINLISDAQEKASRLFEIAKQVEVRS